MKKIVLALVGAGLCVPGAAIAQADDPNTPGRFATRGECQSAAKVAKRDERFDEEPGRKRGHPDAPQFSCVEDRQGGFNLVEQ